jgi:TRAP-type mannitol/chloroaromatic compound transport system permease small subunit
VTDAILWLLARLLGGVTGIFTALTNPSAWLDWSNPEAMVAFIYYGGSVEFFFAVFDVAVIVLVVGLFRRRVLWGAVRAIEAVNNTVGRVFAWAGLIMVLQQVLIIILQRIFRVSEITLSPLGIGFVKDLSWYSEELKLYNAMIVALCAAYTFIQGGHVRVDLFYAGMSYRRKRLTDMLGSLLFIIPFTTIVWMNGWYFLWRSLVTPKVSQTDTLEALLRKARLLKWNVETIGQSPNGFDAYFLFKILLVSFAGLMFLQGIAFFYRNLLEYLEGPESAGKHLDRDITTEEEKAIENLHEIRDQEAGRA